MKVFLFVSVWFFFVLVRSSPIIFPERVQILQIWKWKKEVNYRKRGPEKKEIS